MEIIRQIWQMYDKEGNGYLNKVEAHHFCKNFYKYYSTEHVKIDELVFDNWY